MSLRGAPCFSLLSLSILSSVCLRSPLSPAKTVRYSKRVSSGNLHVLPVRKRCSVSTVAGWERSARLALPCLSCSCVRCVDTFDSCDLARVASLFLSSLRSFFFVFSVPSYAHFISRSSIFNPFLSWVLEFRRGSNLDLADFTRVKSAKEFSSGDNS